MRVVGADGVRPQSAHVAGTMNRLRAHAMRPYSKRLDRQVHQRCILPLGGGPRLRLLPELCLEGLGGLAAGFQIHMLGAQDERIASNSGPSLANRLILGPRTRTISIPCARASRKNSS